MYIIIYVHTIKETKYIVIINKEKRRKTRITMGIYNNCGVFLFLYLRVNFWTLCCRGPLYNSILKY